MTPLPPLHLPAATTLAADGSLPQGALPQITAAAANYHVYAVGREAQVAAEAQGMDPEAGRALLNAAAGGKVIRGVRFPPLTAGFVMMLSFLDEAVQSGGCTLLRDVGYNMAMAYCLVQQEQAWALLEAKDWAAFQRAVWTFGKDFNTAELLSLVSWINADLATLRRDAEARQQLGK